MRTGKHKFLLGLLTGLVIAAAVRRSARPAEKWNRP